MEWLNYHHLLYFWVVAREGTIAAACDQLGLAQPTISAQIRSLEQSLGHKLFRRMGRNLVLTEIGQEVYRYADEIFTLGQELMDALKGRPVGRGLQLLVGVADVLPKLVAHRLITPALTGSEVPQLICVEGRTNELLARLALHELDVVLTDTPVGAETRVQAYNHLLGSSPTSIFAGSALAKRYRAGFPKTLDGAPFVLPTGNTVMRRLLDRWFEEEDVRPIVVGEFEDSALMKVFGQADVGLFPAPSVIEKEIRRQYSVELVGRIEAVRESFYAISVERRITHPGVRAITQAARKELFA
ncbi:MAG: transcriptional activator NhaR [Phycisphaerales bacterium]|nr:MAG: transcriptional activator NhaR [Phycisphaerales bacterium]